MNRTGSGALSAYIDADITSYEAAMADVDALMSRVTNSINSKLAPFDRRLAEVGKSFGKGIDVRALQEMERELTAVQARIEGMFRGSGGDARGSAGFFAEALGAGDEVRRLEGQLDPAVAALHRYEAAQASVARAVAMGAVEQAQANRVLALAEQQYQRQVQGLTAAGQRGVRAFGGIAGAAQQAGYQIGDFAVQVASGQSPLIAFTQQGTQLLQVFGPWGSIIGAAGAILGATAVAMWDFGDSAESAEDRMRNLTSAIEDYRAATKEANASAAEMAEKYGALAPAAGAFLDALAQEKGLKALDALNAEVEDLLSDLHTLKTTSAAGFSAVADAMRGVGDGIARAQALAAAGIAPKAFTEIRADLSDLAETLGVGVAEATALARAMASLREARGLDDQAAAMKALLDTLDASGVSLEDMNRAMRALRERAAEAGLATADLAGAGDNAAGALSRAAEQAERIADAIQNSVDAAARLGQASAGALRESELRLKYKSDPVALAGALAGERFDAGVDMSVAGNDPAFSQALEAQRAQQVAEAERAARNDQQLAAWQAAQREAASAAARAASAASRAGKSAERDEAQIAAAITDAETRLKSMTTALEAELDALGLTDDALALHTAQVEAAALKQDLLNKAKKEGRDLTPGEVAEVDRLSAAYVGLSVAVDAQKRAAEEAKESNRQLYESFSGAITQADSFADALRNVALAIAEMAARGAILGEGPLSGLQKLLTGAAISLVGGGSTAPYNPTTAAMNRAAFDVLPRANGGPVEAGRAYAINEHLHAGQQTEVWVPSRSGGVMNVAQMQDAVRGGMGGGIGRLELQVYLDDDGRLAGIARQAGASAAGPVAIEVTRRAMAPTALNRAMRNAGVRG